MFLSTLLFAAGLLVAETPDTLKAVTIVADKGVVVSRADTVALRADGTAADALLRIPGLGISDYGGLAGLKGANLRGLGTPHTDIYLDGVRVSNFQSGQNDLGMLPVETLGNVVVDYAQNSLSFRTARPVFGRSPFAGRIGLQAGSFGTWMPSVRFDVKASERVAISAYASGILTKGDFPYGDAGARRGFGAARVAGHRGRHHKVESEVLHFGDVPFFAAILFFSAILSRSASNASARTLSPP